MAEPGRRTVVIRGQVVDRYSPRHTEHSHRPRGPQNGGRPRNGVRPRQRRPYDLPRSRPDRIAMWAVLLGLVLLLAAATSSHAAIVHVVAGLH
jgi:hypothetical protein